MLQLKTNIRIWSNNLVLFNLLISMGKNWFIQAGKKLNGIDLLLSFLYNENLAENYFVARISILHILQKYFVNILIHINTFYVNILLTNYLKMQHII